jgi:hypothetical protein
MGRPGTLGRGHGRLGAPGKAGTSEDPAPEGAPEMQFDDELNSQLLAVLDDF